MKLYRTNDTAGSIRSAFDAFTHVLVNRGYTTIKPVFFRSGKIADLPVFQWAWWDKSTAGQLDRWRENGGVLIDRYTTSERAGPADVLVFVECPLTMNRVERSMTNVAEYGVIPRPHTWRVHEEAIDLRMPDSDRLRLLWDICRGACITDDELADRSGLPKQVVQYQRGGLRSVEQWDIRPRLAPESPGLLPAWGWIGTGREESKKTVREAGHKAAIKEMARLGHVSLRKYRAYPADEPDWGRLEKKRQQAIADLAEVRSLVESLPDHLQA
ncbi:hypothetical protein [Burkholderia stagnalis]|uniref:hypothetical protein n=1 Tax=Burkholderia stagnalis TaxID=1503054 RepID=UPI0009C02B06|nr:hypothetical protein [Burkholderia stagnalis]